MKFGKLKIKNFFRIKYLEVDLSKSGLCYVIGINKDTGESNESGKSTIFNALCWCLYGRYPGGPAKPGDEVINPLFSDEICEVEVELIGEENAIIKRQRNSSEDAGGVFINIGNRSSLSGVRHLKSNGKSISNRDLQIIDWIGVLYESFIKCNYYPQFGIEPFGEMTDKQLKQYFIDKLLNISWTEEAYKKAKGDKEQVQKEIIRLETTLESFQQRKSQYENEIKAKSLNKESWDSEKEISLRSYAEKINNLHLQKEQLKQQCGGAQSIIKSLESNPKDSKILRKRAETKAQQVDKIIQDIRDFEQKIKMNEHYLEEIENEFENTPEEGERCPTCGSIVGDDAVGYKYLNNIKKKKPFVDQINEWSRLLKEYRSKRTEMQSEAQKDMEYVIALEQKEKETDKQISELKAFLQYNTAEDLNERIKDIKKQIKDKKKETNPYSKIIEELTFLINSIVLDMESTSKKLKELQDKLVIIEFWKKGFSTKGIQSFLLESITPTINESIKKYMEDLSDGRIKAYFTTVKKLKSGEYRENFHLNIENRDGGDTYYSLSGGARKRVELACSLAIADFHRTISNNQLEFICLDEVTSFLDSYWEERFLRMLQKYHSNVPCFIISHKNTLKNSLLSRNIVVEKHNGITRLLEETS
jgi:DNA repair exonuclease SbcCD ATPase subunit